METPAWETLHNYDIEAYTTATIVQVNFATV